MVKELILNPIENNGSILLTFAYSRNNWQNITSGKHVLDKEKVSLRSE